MPSKTALVDFAKCHPQECEGGVRLTAAACSHRLLKQDGTDDASRGGHGLWRPR